MVSQGPTALFNDFELTTSSGKQLEVISHAHKVSLMCKLISLSKVIVDLSIGFDRDCVRKQQELTNNKNIKSKYHLRIMLKDVFGSVEIQEKATYGLGCKLTPTRNEDVDVLDKAVGIADAGIKIDHFHWFMLHYTLSIQQQGILSKQILSKTPTEFRYIERSVFMKEVNNQNLWTFELGSQESLNDRIWIIIGFQDRQDSQNLNKVTFCKLPVTSAQCNIGTGNYPDASILLNYDDDDYSQGYGQIIEVFGALTKDDILQLYISNDDFRSSNISADDIGYNLYVFDIRYKQKLTAS